MVLGAPLNSASGVGCRPEPCVTDQRRPQGPGSTNTTTLLTLYLPCVLEYRVRRTQFVNLVLSMSFVLYPDLWVHGQASCNVLGSGITKNYLISLFVIDHFGVLLFVVLENEEKVNCELLEVLTGGEMAQTAGVLAEPTDSGWPDARVPEWPETCMEISEMDIYLI